MKQMSREVGAEIKIMEETCSVTTRHDTTRQEGGFKEQKQKVGNRISRSVNSQNMEVLTLKGTYILLPRVYDVGEGYLLSNRA